MSADTTSETGQSPEYATRLAFWQATDTRINQKAVERGDSPIDPGIHELVVGLNAVGFHTDMSHQGEYDGSITTEVRGRQTNHVRWQSPWIAFYDPNFDEYTTEQHFNKLQTLLTEFYEEREVLPLYKLQAEFNRNAFSLTAGSTRSITDTTLLRPSAEIIQEASTTLAEQQKQIREFSDFIKKRYLETGFQIG